MVAGVFPSEGGRAANLEEAPNPNQADQPPSQAAIESARFLLRLSLQQPDLIQLLERSLILLEALARSSKHEKWERIGSGVGYSSEGCVPTKQRGKVVSLAERTRRKVKTEESGGGEGGTNHERLQVLPRRAELQVFR